MVNYQQYQSNKKRIEILQSPENSLEKTIDSLLNCKEYSWDKIYLFSAFVHDYGVKQIKKILVHPSLNANTEVWIAIGQKDNFNDPSDIKKILNLSTSLENMAENVKFICPETIKNFHIKAYCFLGSTKEKSPNTNIGFSIIGSSNLTWRGLKCEGELCISLQNLNLTIDLIKHLNNKYVQSPQWSPKIITEYERQYNNEEHSRKDQNEVIHEVLPQSQENSTPVNQDQQPIPNRQKCIYLELGVMTDSDLNTKATNLVNGREKIDIFHWSNTTIEQAKEDLPELSLCLLFLTENQRFTIGEILSHSSDQEETKGCFVTYTENVNYERSEDIREILEKEEYKEISRAKNREELRYKTLKNFEEEVKEYQEYQKMLNDPKYKKWIEKGNNKMQSEFDSRLGKLEDENAKLKAELDAIKSQRRPQSRIMAD